MRKRAVALVFAAAGASAEGASRPHILFIMTDDHASHAISAYGSKLNQTPQLDRLAKTGMLFRNAFVTNSICTPSRAAILTGKYSHLNGVPVFNRFDGSQQTVAKLLQAGGYYTGMIGKWHLGSDPTGFDHWEILPGQGAYRDPLLYTASGQKTYPGYVTDVLTDLALEFLRKRPSDRPFFLMWHHKAPHRPWEPDERYRKLYENRWIPEPPTFWDGYQTRTDALRENEQRVASDLTRRDLKLTPPSGLEDAERARWLAHKPAEHVVSVDGRETRLTGEALARWKYQRYMQDYLACVQSVDDGVGRVLDLLKAAGLRHRPDGAQRRLRADVPRSSRPPRAGRDAGPEPAADPEGQAAGRLAHVDVLPLLPRPRRPQHPRALWRAHDDPQADPFLEEGPVGVVRSAEGPP